MHFEVEFRPRALKDLASIPRVIQQRIIEKIELLQDNLTGDVKRLTDHTPEFRLRVGDHRVLFAVDTALIVIVRIKHRSDAYRP